MPSFSLSSRRRHTISLCDWSSDVCSSDLAARPRLHRAGANARHGHRGGRILLRIAEHRDMGIKDLFGKGKKKADFREAAKEVLTGKLTPGKAAELESLRREHDVEDAGDDKTMLRRDVYNKAVGSVRARGKLSDAEAAELAKIQKFLALRDDQAERTKWDLV